MARSKGKRRKKASPAGESPAAGGKKRKLKTWEMVVLAVLAAGAAWGGWSWWRSGSLEGVFLAHVAEGASQLSRVETPPSLGTGHLAPGQSAGYGDRFPTSGAHDQRWVRSGVYGAPKPVTQLVHSLEHGLVVVHIDKPGEAAMATLESWVSLYGGAWSGVVVVQAPGLGEEVVLTAWRKRLRLDTFEPPAAAAFIDRYRGRGPENRVR